jgi:molecular chaperone GrpE (heat shock protein)
MGYYGMSERESLNVEARQELEASREYEADVYVKRMMEEPDYDQKKIQRLKAENNSLFEYIESLPAKVRAFKPTANNATAEIIREYIEAIAKQLEADYDGEEA